LNVNCSRFRAEDAEARVDAFDGRVSEEADRAFREGCVVEADLLESLELDL